MTGDDLKNVNFVKNFTAFLQRSFILMAYWKLMLYWLAILHLL